MPFTKQSLQSGRGINTAYTTGQGFTLVKHSYINLGDTFDTISAENYFPPNFISSDSSSLNVAPQPLADEFFINDLLFIRASDMFALVPILGVNPVVIGSNLLGSSGSLIVSYPIDAIDNNGAVISGGLFELEFADAAHNGILSTVIQTIAGSKTFIAPCEIDGTVISNNSVALSTNVYLAHIGSDVFLNYDTSTYLGFNIPSNTLSFYVDGNPIFAASDSVIDIGLSGTPVNIDSPLTFTNGGGTINQLSYYETSAAWTGPFAGTINTNLKATLINNQVMLSVGGIPTTSSGTTNTINLTGTLPVNFRPAQNRIVVIGVTNNSTLGVAIATILTTGQIIIGSNLAGGNFNAAGNVGVYDWSTNYNLN